MVDEVDVVDDAAAVPFTETVLLPPAETVLLPFGTVALPDWVGCALPPDAATEEEEGAGCCDADEEEGRVRLRCCVPVGACAAADRARMSTLRVSSSVRRDGEEALEGMAGVGGRETTDMLGRGCRQRGRRV